MWVTRSARHASTRSSSPPANSTLSAVRRAPLQKAGPYTCCSRRKAKPSDSSSTCGVEDAAAGLMGPGCRQRRSKRGFGASGSVTVAGSAAHVPHGAKGSSTAHWLELLVVRMAAAAAGGRSTHLITVVRQQHIHAAEPNAAHQYQNGGAPVCGGSGWRLLCYTHVPCAARQPA